jgi:hypothetical protein
MRLVSANHQKFRNFNYTKDIKTLTDVLGKVPTYGNRVINLFDGNQMLKNVAGFEKVMPAEKYNIQGQRYDWGVNAVPVYTTTIAVSVAEDYNLGRNGQPFTICLSEEIANVNDIIYLSNRQALYVKANAISTNGYFLYSVQLSDNEPSLRGASFAAMKEGMQVSVIFNAQPELSRVGYNSMRTKKEKRFNYMTKIRVGDEYSGDSAMTDFIICDDLDLQTGKRTGKYKPVSWMTGMEKQHMDKLSYYSRMSQLFSKSTMSLLGDDRCYLQDSMGNDIVIGDGIYEAIRRDGIVRPYRLFTEETLKEIVYTITSAMPTKPMEGCKVTLVTGYDGYVMFDTAMREILKVLPFQSSDLFTQKSGGKTDIGIEFGKYRYLGVEFTIVREPSFDNPNFLAQTTYTSGFNNVRGDWSRRFLVIDTSTYDGVPNIVSLQKDGCSLIKSETLGVGGRDGKTSGISSTRVHGSAVDYITYTGSVVHVPETCMILEPSAIL